MPIQTVSTGTPQLMIPVADLEVLRAAGDFFLIHPFCLRGITG